MGAIKSHRDLIAWQRAMDFVVAVYKTTSAWPRDELYGLTSQTRRAAVSVPANIAEGYGRENLGSYIRFLRIAQGSLKEVETHVEIARRIGILDEAICQARLQEADEMGRILHRLIRSLEAEA
ncbi:MAG: four helix bundle protein [Caulobacteraceae bacterium]